MGRNKKAIYWKRNRSNIFYNRRRYQKAAEDSHVQDADNRDIPGFYFDSETQTYFRVTPENYRYFEEKKIIAQYKKSGAVNPRSCSYCKVNNSLTCELIGREYQKVEGRHFCERILRTRLKMMKEVYCTQLLNTDFIPESCQIMVGNPSCGSIVGAWKTSQGTVLCNHRFLNESKSRLRLSVESSVFGLHFQHVMTDLCVAKLANGLECILCVGNPARPSPEPSRNQSTMHLYPIRELCDVSTPENRFAFDSSTLNMEQSESALWSCAWNQNMQNFAFGCEGFAMFMSMQNNPGTFYTKLAIPRENIFSLEFNKNGNVLYCGTNKGNLNAFDLRTQKLVSNIKLVRGLSYLKLLSCDQYAIGSCYDHKLFQVDLRAKKVVIDYLEHNNEHLKLPFSVSERSGFLCSVGQDRFTRIWNLKDGKILFTTSPERYGSHHPYAWFSEEWSFRNSCFDTALIVNSGDELITSMP